MKKLLTLIVIPFALILSASATVFPFPGIEFTIKSEDTGRYLSAESGNIRMTANREVAGDSEIFVTEMASNNQFYIKNVSTGKYVRQHSNRRLRCNASLANATLFTFNTVSTGSGWATHDGVVIVSVLSGKHLKEVGAGATDYVRATTTKTTKSFRWVFERADS